MASWTTYKGLTIPDAAIGDAGGYLTSDLKAVADGAAHVEATSDPTGSNDSSATQGYFPGSTWFNKNTKVMWVCTDTTTTGAAKWRSLYQRIDNAIVLMPSAGVGGGSDGRALQMDSGGNDRGTNAVDLQRQRSNATQVASGLRSGVLSGSNNSATSTDVVVSGGHTNKAGGSSGTITAISVGNPTTVTSNGHGLITGEFAVFGGTNSTPALIGTMTVTVIDANSFTVPVHVTGAGTTGTWNVFGDHASVAGGNINHAFGDSAHVAGGSYNNAFAKNSHVEGSLCSASGICGHAEGQYTQATGLYSHAEGSSTLSSGNISHAEGDFTIASGLNSHTEGYYTSASGVRSHAEGSKAYATGTISHAEGRESLASGYAAHAEGEYTTADGFTAHAEGFECFAGASYTHAGGYLSHARLLGQWARASGGSGAGTAQVTITSLFVRTTDGAATELTLDGNSPVSGNRFLVANNQTLSCFINVVGRKESGGSGSPSPNAACLYHALICNQGGTMVLVSTTLLSSSYPSSWGVTIQADNTNKSLQILVTGVGSTNIRWTGIVFASESADSGV